MVAFTKHDLQFILDGIIVSESHAAQTNSTSTGSWVQADIETSRQTLLSLVPNSFEPIGMRTITGELNNLIDGNENFGATGEFPRLAEADYRDDGATGNPADATAQGPGTNTDYAVSDGPSNTSGSNGNVVDSDPRIISNLLVDQSVHNPAAVAAAGANAGTDGTWGTADDELGDGVELINPDGVAGSGDEFFFIPNTAPDEGLSAPFNEWMTFFGQFFDHGLDLVNKGGSGTIFIPLQPDDPLVLRGRDGVAGTGDEIPAGTPLILTRATVDPGPDGLLGTADDVADAFNATSPFVDQNQTYTSHPSHQLFMREYVAGPTGPTSTGHLIEGTNGGLATWADVKVQANTLLGIELTDADAINIPLFAVDQYGEFLPGANGLPQFVMSDGSLVEAQFDGDGTGMSVAEAEAAAGGGLTVQRTGFSFLVDIAHSANPFDNSGAPLIRHEDGDANDGLDGGAGTYDGDLFDAHYVAGDGRANENFALTAVHHVFHQEHNRLVTHTQEALVTNANSGDVPDALGLLQGFLTAPLPVGFQLVDPDDQAAIDAAVASLSWDGDRLFQAAKFGTEMQYQHLVFEEFGRKVHPAIDIFASFEGNVDPSIVAEFAHTVYRFGHSMLTENVDVMAADGTLTEVGLIEAFLNPIGFHQDVLADGTVTSGAALSPEEAAGAIVRGLSRGVGSEIDEFVTEALRNNLLGLPLDLAAINIARGRDTGIPTLNAARDQFFALTGDVRLKPYESWFDFALNLKHEDSIINFLAAYGQHATITGAVSLADKRAAALDIVLGGAGAPADRSDFLNGTGAWANQETGLNLVDLWIGGLAERIEPFGGMLGTTFTFVFEDQMERLQDGDRFYYLGRTAGLNFVTQLEQNSFAGMIIRNTDIGDNGADHLPGDIFSTPHFILEVDPNQQVTNLVADGFGGVIEQQGGRADPVGDSILLPLVLRDNPHTAADESLTNTFLQYTGGDHVVLGGGANNETLIGGIGDDTLWGDAGDDDLFGGDGSDIIIGGDGDDLIIDIGGEDNLQGLDGNDVIISGAGEDLILAGPGKDFVLMGPDLSETFGGLGDDFIHLGTESNIVIGGEGSDWLEGGGGNNLLQGDNADPFLNSTIVGHDVFLPGEGDDDYDSESGDDVMVGGIGVQRFEGVNGFDWATYFNDVSGVDVDMFLRAFDETPIPPSPATIMDRFDQTEALSGSAFGDILRASDADELVLRTLNNGGDHVLRNFELIQGLRSGDFGGAFDATALFDASVTEWAGGDIVLGGGGSDLIEPRGGNDIVDGDLALGVRLLVRDPNTGDAIATADHMHGDLFAVDPATGVPVLDGVTGERVPTNVNGFTKLHEAVEGRAINPGNLHIVREILDQGEAGDFDTVVFSGNLAEYAIEGSGTANGFADIDGDGFVSVTHTADGADGSDLLRNIERLQFADQSLEIPGLNNPVSGAPLIVLPGSSTPALAPAVGDQLEALIGTIADGDGVPDINGFSFQWQFEEEPGSGVFVDFEITNGSGETGPLTGRIIEIPDVALGSALRVVASFRDGAGIFETAFSLPTGIVAGGVSTPPTNGDDAILGTNQDDDGVTQPILEGLDGDDTIQALAGDDILVGGSLADENNAGNDVLDGGPGSDRAIFFGDPLDVTAFEFAIAPDENDPSINRLEIVDLNSGEEDLLIDVEIAEFRLADGTVLELSVENLIIQLENDTTADPDLAVIATPTAGDDRLVGTSLDDTIDGLAGNDTILGLSGNDDLTGGAGSDTSDGGPGDDILRLNLSAPGELDQLIGGDGTDTADFSGFASAVWVSLEYPGVEAWTRDTPQYHDASGTWRTIADLDGIENIAGSAFDDFLRGDSQDNRFIYTGGIDQVRGSTGNDTLDFSAFAFAVWVDLDHGVEAWTRDGVDLISGTYRPIVNSLDVENAVGTVHHDRLAGDSGINVLEGLQGDDLILADGGDDLIIWNAGDGHDVIDGGANDPAGDTVEVNGTTNSETFRIYAVTDPTVMLPAGLAALRDGNTEVVITHDDGSGEQIVAELQNVEELVINTRDLADPPSVDPTGDTIEVIGDFSGTSLNLNTITINGGSENDTVDISQLTSDHRIVFNTNGGTDTVVGPLRPQDGVNIPNGSVVSDNRDGTFTIRDETNEPEVTVDDVTELLNIVRGLPSDNLRRDDATGIRDLEGTGNNVANPDFGSADQPFIRLTQARYGDPIEENGSVINRALNPIYDGLDPRDISNTIGDQADAPPAPTGGVNVLFNAFGQYFDHGLDFVPKGGNGTDPEANTVAIGGPGFSPVPGVDNPIDLTRATVDGFDASGNPEHLNKTSPFVDQNQTYGSTELVGQFLRESDGNGGFGARLFAGQPDPSNPDFALLPTLRELVLHHWNAGSEFSDPAKFAGTLKLGDVYPGLVDANNNIDETILRSLSDDFMGSGQTLLLDFNGGIPFESHYVAGDGRANENVTLTAVHNVWAREHNRLVEELIDNGFLMAGGSVAELYEAAKIINVAQYQRIVYEEFADALLGGMPGGNHGFDDYDPTVDARISHEFAGAAYRFGHSLLAENVTILDENGDPQDISLVSAFLNPSNAAGPGYAELGVASIIGGIATQASEAVDFNVVDAVRDNLVRLPADLFAFNVARGRDLGLGTLNQIKRDLNDSTDAYVRDSIDRGVDGDELLAYTSWLDFQTRNDLSDAVIQQFQSAYPDLDLNTLSQAEQDAFHAANPDVPLINGHIVQGIDRVDFWVGALAEKAVNDGIVGETFWVILHEQLDRLQEGDRFYYLDRVDKFDFYDGVEDQTFADIIARNTGLTDLSDTVFLTQSNAPGLPDGTTPPPVGDDDDDDDDNTAENIAPVVGQPINLGDLVTQMTMSVSIVILLDQLLAGATDPDGNDNALQVTNLRLAAGTVGTLTDNGDGTFTYTAEAGDVSNAQFVYDVSDGTDTTQQIASLDLISEEGAVVTGTAGEDTLTGTALDDLISGHASADVLSALAGDDVVSGGDGGDTLLGGDGNDILIGGEGNDRLFGEDGDDMLFGDAGDDDIWGGEGSDLAFGDTGNDRIWGDAGDDILEGGAGIDEIDGGIGNDTILASRNDGDDIYKGGSGIDTYDLSGTTADSVIDLISGLATGSEIGTDNLSDIENVVGGFGNDQITANSATNVMTGGSGDDQFLFMTSAHANGDRVTDFQPGDQIDLSGIAAAEGPGAFVLVTTPTFSGAGEIMFGNGTDTDGGAITLIHGNVSGGANADFTIEISGSVSLNIDGFNVIYTV